MRIRQGVTSLALAVMTITVLLGMVLLQIGQVVRTVPVYSSLPASGSLQESTALTNLVACACGAALFVTALILCMVLKVRGAQFWVRTWALLLGATVIWGGVSTLVFKGLLLDLAPLVLVPPLLLVAAVVPSWMPGAFRARLPGTLGKSIRFWFVVGVVVVALPATVGVLLAPGNID